ncbi:MAG: Type 1 glutamine amidotransferase-like domain-containing protein [Candidatus Uhrbacteria bacterium]
MNLFLTSAGLTNKKIKDRFKNETLKLENTKVVVLFTAGDSRTPEWRLKHEQIFGELGLKCDFINISEAVDLTSQLSDYGIFYVCGGNTFYILDRLRKTGVIQVLLDSMIKNKLYVGSSAGSIVMCPDVEIAGVGFDGDKNEIELKDLKGLNRVPFFIMPHYDDYEREILENFSHEKNKSVVALTDQQAIFVEGDKFVLLGDNGGLEIGCVLEKDNL